LAPGGTGAIGRFHHLGPGLTPGCDPTDILRL
jgi:hypothetical protein